MKIELRKITIREIAEGYVDNQEEGVSGFGGKLNIRPKYQREFVYGEKKRNAVIETIRNGFPLNVMYWVRNGEDSYEILDGQQRTISFCQYVHGNFTIMIDGHAKAFYNLTEEEKQQILDYELMIYICDGAERDKLNWFETINIAGEQLTDQELRNAVFTGPWLTHAKTIFSKSNCAAYLLARDYVNGSPIRQEFLETAISWINNGDIDGYMSKNQHSPNAEELWNHFQKVIKWVREIFPSYRREMKGLNWGQLYSEFAGQKFDVNMLEKEIEYLMIDDDVTNKRGIYHYVLTRNERYLNIRAFSESQKRSTYERQKGICKKCDRPHPIESMDADHITPWSKGGKTSIENLQMLCRECNRRKSNV